MTAKKPGHQLGAAGRRLIPANLKNFAQPSQALTQPMRGLARVAGRQLAQVALNRHRQRIYQKEQARETLSFALRLAETMFHYGADAADVDAAVVTVCATYGIQDVEVDITYQSIIINYVSEVDDLAGSGSHVTEGTEKLALNLVRVVRSTSENYRALEKLYHLIRSIAADDLTRTQAERQLARINNAKKPYSPATLLAWNLVMAAAFTLGVGGSWRAAVTSIGIFALVNFTLVALGRLALPSYFTMAIASGVITTLAVTVSRTESWFFQQGFIVSAPHLIAAGLMMFLPTFRLVSAVQDALHGFPLTAAGKLVMTAVNFTGLIAGIAVALTLISYFDYASLDARHTVFNPPPLWLSMTGMAIGSAMSAAAWQGSLANIWLVVVLSFAGQGVYYSLAAVTGTEAGHLHLVAGAFTVGLGASLIGYLLHTPASIYYVPGMMFMLPGLTIFRSSYQVLMGRNGVADGLQGLVGAGLTVLLMATGIVLGTYLWDAVTSKVGRRRSVEVPVDGGSPLGC
ncbi:threonine/serine ThrE exporter family protein [Rothia nasimurium]|uniref:threonine/serine ThrE exporter family protein n=1 Tax=Rothia nasimurium TaxID=85336 RepID=UPI003BA12CCD